MVDLGFGEEPITAIDPDEVIAGPGVDDTDYKSSETLILDGVAWPGQWTIEPSGAKRDIDKKKPHGKHGYRMRDKGTVGQSVRCIGTLTDQERVDCEELLDAAEPSEDNPTIPRTITHPDCTKIGPVFVEHLKRKSPQSGRDFHEIEILLSQWFAEPKEVKEPVPETPGVPAFQALRQDPGPFGTEAAEADRGVPGESFADSIGRLADGTKSVTQPDQLIPPYEEPG